MTGTLYGLGVGPGNSELITVKALRLLKAASVVAYPAPQNGESLARRIVADHLRGDQLEIPIRMPMLAQRFPAQEVYEWAAEELGAHLLEGRDVAVLCQGDPFFYGSFMYLFARMAERFAVEVVPGVSSLTACAAVAGAPLGARNDILTVLPAAHDEERLRSELTSADAAAVIKVGRHLEKVRRVLIELGLAREACYVEHATMDTQRVCALEEFGPHEAPYFSMILVHRRGVAWR